MPRLVSAYQLTYFSSLFSLPPSLSFTPGLMQSHDALCPVPKGLADGPSADNSAPAVCHVVGSKPIPAGEDFSCTCKDGKRFALCRHGKSRYPSLWDLEDVALSNAQLLEMGPELVSGDGTYITPPGGLQAGLCGRALWLFAPNTEANCG